ncbi:MAG: ABC transporter ATP-binding protein [Candidatus Paceibacterota bacterium]
MSEKIRRIEIKNLSKKFRADFRKSDTALSRFVGLLSGHTEKREIPVLDDISFEVSAGEILGIIGKNGAGKSTLLRLIAEVYQPDSGQITTRGKTVYLTGVNQGSVPKLTMRENIYLMGSVMGLSQKDIGSRFDEIVDFSGLREFVDMKVYQFSTGMLARLNFSTVIHCIKHQSPDILLLDEILSSGGDAKFKEKATQRMDDLIKGGAAVILVSHDEESILKNCHKAIWLDQGKIREIGTPASVFQKYLEAMKLKPENTSQS